MLLGKVIGSIVCTFKTPALEGKKLLLVQPLDRAQEPAGQPLVCVDSVGAGAGETVYWAKGREASMAFPNEEVPTEATIVAIVDRVTAAAE